MTSRSSFHLIQRTRNPVLIELDLKLPLYRLMQVRRKRILLLTEKMICLQVPKGDWVTKGFNVLANARRKCLVVLTQSFDDPRQIWLVDMKVKL